MEDDIIVCTPEGQNTEDTIRCSSCNGELYISACINIALTADSKFVDRLIVDFETEQKYEHMTQEERDFEHCKIFNLDFYRYRASKHFGIIYDNVTDLQRLYIKQRMMIDLYK